MPKPGYSIIIVSDSVKQQLESIARSKGFRTVNQLLEAWLRVNPRVYPDGGEPSLAFISLYPILNHPLNLTYS
ncbi:MAG: hypothetical protein QXM89_04205 [Candidatus Bathyarchaeia archaeon]